MVRLLTGSLAELQMLWRDNLMEVPQPTMGDILMKLELVENALTVYLTYQHCLASHTLSVLRTLTFAYIWAK